MTLLETQHTQKPPQDINQSSTSGFPLCFPIKSGMTKGTVCAIHELTLPSQYHPRFKKCIHNLRHLSLMACLNKRWHTLAEHFHVNLLLHIHTYCHHTCYNTYPPLWLDLVSLTPSYFLFHKACYNPAIHGHLGNKKWFVFCSEFTEKPSSSTHWQHLKSTRQNSTARFQNTTGYLWNHSK